MIHHFLILNTSGLPRLTKHYIPLALPQQQELLRDVYEKIRTRPENNAACCFIDIDQQQYKQHGESVSHSGTGDEAMTSNGGGATSSMSDRTSKIVYRGFATLYFIIVCDDAESELGLLDLIQVIDIYIYIYMNLCRKTCHEVC